MIYNSLKNIIAPPCPNFEREPVYQYYRLSKLVEVLLFCFVFFLLYDDIILVYLYVWLAIFVVLRLPFWIRVLFFRLERSQKSYLIIMISSLLAGVAWAALPVLLFQQIEPAQQTFITLAIAGLVIFCFGVFMPNVRMIAYCTFFPMVALLVMFFLGEGMMHYAISILIASFIGVQRIVMKNLHSVYKKLNLALKQAEEASHTKSEFLANMSHEIRTPMNAIISTGNLLQNNNLTTAVRQDYINKLQYTSNLLLNTLNSLLDFSKVEAKRMRLDCYDFTVKEIVNNIQSIFSAELEKKKLSFAVNVDKNVQQLLRGDSLKIGQVLINLVSNAIKFTENGGVVLTIHMQDRQKDRVCLFFSIQDTGIGIHPDDQEKLFKPFVQVNSSHSRQYGGTGIGLSLSQQLLKLMDSHIEIQSMPNIGTKLSFLLWLKESNNKQGDLLGHATKHSARALRVIPELQNKSILIIEDSALNQFYIKKLLEQFGVQNITMTETAEEGIGCLKKQSFDLLLLDIQLPKMDGYEAIKKIRLNNQWQTLPVVCLTAHVSDETASKALHAGMNDYLSKPIEPQKLRNILLRWLVEEKHTTE